MNINIYYGGRGLVDDPTIFAINKIQEVLNELNVNVTRYNLYEMKNTITTLSQTITEADGVIFATTVEWVGMGGYMQTLLDSCWLYSDKSQVSDVSSIYALNDGPIFPPIISHELFNASVTSRSPYVLAITTGNIYTSDTCDLSEYNQHESSRVCI